MLRFGEALAQELRDRGRAILGFPAPVPPLLGKHAGGTGQVELFDLPHRHAPGKTGGDDRTGAGSGEQVKHIRQNQVVPALFLPEDGLQATQNL